MGAGSVGAVGWGTGNSRGEGWRGRRGEERVRSERNSKRNTIFYFVIEKGKLPRTNEWRLRGGEKHK